MECLSGAHFDLHYQYHKSICPSKYVITITMIHHKHYYRVANTLCNNTSITIGI